MHHRKRTALVIGGLAAVAFFSLEVAYFGFTALFTALGVWVVLVGPALVVTPRRGPEDELWVSGLVRELLHRFHGRSGDAGEAQAPGTPPPPPTPESAVAQAAEKAAEVTAPPARDDELWPVALFRAVFQRLDGESAGRFFRRHRLPPRDAVPAVSDPAQGESASERQVQLSPDLRLVAAEDDVLPVRARM